LIGKASFH